jgi:DNA-binding response OmpR family regulator
MGTRGACSAAPNCWSSVWGYGHDGYDHTVNSHINRLRAKLEPDPAEPGLIVTVWGVGYKLDAAQGARARARNGGPAGAG